MKATEEYISWLIDDMYIEEFYDDINMNEHPDNALSETFWEIQSLLPKWLNFNTEMEWTRYKNIWDYLINWYETSLCFHTYWWYDEDWIRY